MRFYELQEANRVASAIRLDEIPQKYKNLPLLGRGTTSIVLDEGPTVLMFTRDHMKVEWLRDQEIGQWIDSYTSYKSHIRGMNDVDVVIYRLPKLFPLNLENKRLVRTALKDFDAVRYQNPLKSKDIQAKALYNHFTDQETHILKPLFDFLANYDSKQYFYDLGPRNFMQTLDGKIVVLDPIVSSEIMNLVNNKKINI